MKNTKGLFLAMSAVLIPPLFAFWGWIISSMIYLQLNINQQIMADVSALSGLVYGNGLLATTVTTQGMIDRCETIVKAMSSLNDGTLPTTQVNLSTDRLTLTVNLVSVQQELYFTDNVTINASSSAQTNSSPKFSLLPLT
jgi:hypothetical protein